MSHQLYFITLLFIIATAMKPNDIAYWKQQNKKIAIIGGGASGLYMAYHLYYDFGITNIEIFEKEALPSESTLSFEYFGKNKNIFRDAGIGVFPITDYKIISNDRNNYQINNEIPDIFEEFIDRYNLSYFEADVFKAINIDTSPPSVTSVIVESLVPFLMQNGLTQQDFLSQIINILLVHEQILLNKENVQNINDMRNIPNIHSLKGESATEWYSKNNLLIINRLDEIIYDFGLGIPRFHQHSSSYNLYADSFWRIPLYISILVNVFNLDDTSPTIQSYPFIQTLLKNWINDGNTAIYLVFDENMGFQTLWNKISDDLQSKGITINYNTKVSRVKLKHKHHCKQISVVFNNHVNECVDKPNPPKTKLYDIVFIAVRADDATQILQFDDKLTDHYNLYNEIATEPLVVFGLWRIPCSIQTNLEDIKNAFALTYPTANMAGSDIDNAFDCTLSILVNLNDGTLLGIYGYPPLNVNKQDAWNYCLPYFEQQLIDTFGFEDILSVKNNFVEYKVWTHGTFPNIHNENDDWYENMIDIQGKHNIYMIGEVFAGFTVPLNINWIMQNF